MSTIKIRRGPEATIPTLNVGEFGYTTDTDKLYLGTGVANILLSVNGVAPDSSKLGGVSSSKFLRNDVSGTLTGDLTVNGSIGGTAVTQSTTDTTADRLLKVGDFAYNSVVAFYNHGQSTPPSNRIKIRLPYTTNSAKMLQFRIDVYGLYIKESYDVSGYLYATINNWYS